MNNIINNFIHGDAFDVFKQMPDQSVNLTFTSLPDISQTPYKDVKKYQVLQNQACDEMARTTKDDGFVVISQTDRKINARYCSNHITYYNAMLRNGYVLKDYKIMPETIQ